LENIDGKQRRALVDHELNHLNIDIDTGKYSLLPHDLEEFSGIVRRHGLWRDSVKFFIEAAREGEKLPLLVGEQDSKGE
jgi:putative metallopeptidase